MSRVQPFKLDQDEIQRLRKVSVSITNKECVMMNYLMDYYEIGRAELFRQMLKAVYYQTYKEDKYLI